MAFDVFWMNVAAVFAIVNVALVFLLLGLYYQSWRKLRSALTISLMIFALFFLTEPRHNRFLVCVVWSRSRRRRHRRGCRAIPGRDQSDANRRPGQSCQGNVGLT